MNTTKPITAPTVALFDLDHTLIPGDSDHGWGSFLVDRGYVDHAFYESKNDYFYGQYKAGTLNIYEYCEFSFKVLADNDLMTLNEWRDEYMATIIAPMIRPQAVALVKKHRDAGHLCALVTATNDFVTAPIAKALGFDTLIATQAEMVAGRYTGKVAGTPNFQSGKIINVNAWLEGLGLSLDTVAASYFYSDSINDLPLLEQATFPVVIHPDERLAQEAKKRHWPFIELFHSEYAA